MAGSVRKSFKQPDKTINLDKGKVEIVGTRDGLLALARGTAEPGWRWSTQSDRPDFGTNSCPFAHLGWVISGKMRYELDDGDVLEFDSGDVFYVTPGHDAWVVGDEPFEYIEVLTAPNERTGEATE